MTIFSWLGFFGGIIGLWLAARFKHGWLVAALASIPWIIYGIAISTWALVAQSAVYGIVDTWNYIRVLNGRKINRGLDSSGEASTN